MAASRVDGPDAQTGKPAAEFAAGRTRGFRTLRAAHPRSESVIARRRERHAKPLRRAIVSLPVILCLALAASAGAWTLSGGRVVVMSTPSMGTVAPVGSLLLIHPLGTATLHMGMIVAFRVPQTGVVYMHRISALLPHGRFRTRGDLDYSDDGWVLTRASVLGAPSLIIPWVGWLMIGAPWGLGVCAVGLALAWMLPRTIRPALRSVTFGAALALAIYKVRPFVRVTIATAGQAKHRLFANLVNSGMLPLRVTLRSSAMLLRPGHMGLISAHTRGPGTSVLAAHPALPVWGWAMLVAVVLAPLPIAMAGLRSRPSWQREGQRAAPSLVKRS